MMKKRILILGLLLSLLLALTACGETPEVSAVPSATTEDAASQSPAALETTATPSTAPVESTAAETAIPSTAPVESTADDGTDPNLDARGSWEGDVYTNERFGFRIPLPEGWLRSNDYQLAQDNQMTAETYLSSNVSELVREKGKLYVLKMVDYKGSVAALGVAPAVQTEEPYEDTDIIWLVQKNLTENFQKQGQTVKLYEAVPLHLGDQEKAALHLITEQNGTEIEQYMLWFRNDPAIWGVLSIVTYSGLDLQPILDSISLLDPAT